MHCSQSISSIALFSIESTIVSSIVFNQQQESGFHQDLGTIFFPNIKVGVLETPQLKFQQDCDCKNMLNIIFANIQKSIVICRNLSSMGPRKISYWCFYSEKVFRHKYDEECKNHMNYFNMGWFFQFIYLEVGGVAILHGDRDGKTKLNHTGNNLWSFTAMPENLCFQLFVLPLSNSSCRARPWKERDISWTICQSARSMERSIFFFLKSHISAPGAQNSPILFS